MHRETIMPVGYWLTESLQLCVVVVVVNILLQIKRTTLMIGHCTALAVIVTKTLAGKISEPKQEKDEELTTPHVVV